MTIEMVGMSAERAASCEEEPWIEAGAMEGVLTIREEAQEVTIVEGSEANRAILGGKLRGEGEQGMREGDVEDNMERQYIVALLLGR